MKRALQIQLVGLLAGLGVLGASLPAAAVELTPMVGVRFGGDLTDYNSYYSVPSLTLDSSVSYGGTLDIPLARGPYALELYFSHQSTDLEGGQYLQPQVHDMNVNVIHGGIAAALPTNDKRLSFLLIGTAGATEFDAHGSSNFYPSLGLGVGMRMMLSDNIGLRGDLRGIFTFLDNNSYVACGYYCYGYSNNNLTVQGEASVGLVVRF